MVTFIIKNMMEVATFIAFAISLIMEILCSAYLYGGLLIAEFEKGDYQYNNVKSAIFYMAGVSTYWLCIFLYASHV